MIVGIVFWHIGKKIILPKLSFQQISKQKNFSTKGILSSVNLNQMFVCDFRRLCHPLIVALFPTAEILKPIYPSVSMYEKLMYSIIFDSYLANVHTLSLRWNIPESLDPVSMQCGLPVWKIYRCVVSKVKILSVSL